MTNRDQYRVRFHQAPSEGHVTHLMKIYVLAFAVLTLWNVGASAQFVDGYRTHAQTLPKDMLGKWCMIRGWTKTNGAFYYRRDDGHECTTGVEVHENYVWYFEGDAGSFKCDLLSIEPNLDVYLVRNLCHDLDYRLEAGYPGDDNYSLDEFLLTDNDTLVIRRLSEG